MLVAAGALVCDVLAVPSCNLGLVKIGMISSDEVSKRVMSS